MLLYQHKHIFLENWTNGVHGKREKVELGFVKVLIRNQLFHNNFVPKALSEFPFNFLFSWSTFRFYSIYLMCEICNKNISVQKYEKLRNWLFKIKNWIKLFLKKGSSLGLSWRGQSIYIYIYDKYIYIIYNVKYYYSEFYANNAWGLGIL